MLLMIYISYLNTIGTISDKSFAPLLASNTSRSIVSMALSLEQKTRILYLSGQGLSARQIADDVGCSHSTVVRCMQRFRATGSLAVLPRTGRPRATTAVQDEAILQESLARPDLSVPQLTSSLEIPASSRTVNRRLHQAGQCVRTARERDVALSKPALQEKRLVWAETTAREWDGWFDSTVFIDEAVFESSTRHRKRSWMPRASRGRLPNWVMRSGRKSVAVFGGLCGDQLLPLYVCSGKFTADQFRDVLSELYWPVLQEMFTDRPFRLQLDNAPTHRGQAVAEWLCEHPSLQESMMFQPPYSPDLNPIEHVWARMKKKLKGRILKSDAEITSAVIAAWEEVGREKAFLRSLTGSMPRRINSVIAASGGPTKY